MSWIKRAWNWLKDTFAPKSPEPVTPIPKPTEPTQPQAFAPVKLAHGERAPYAGIKGGEIVTMGGVLVRVLDITDDCFIGNEARAAQCVRSQDGEMVADDFKNSAGQIMAFDYWTLGTSDLSARTNSNPVAIRQDSRAWYRTFAALLVMLCLCAIPARAIDVKLAWDLPTTNVDGSALVDLVAFQVDAVRYSASATIVSNVVVSLAFTPLSTNSVLFPARTNSPAGVISQTNILTGLTSGIFQYRCRAVAALDAESVDSNSITNRVGTPGTVVLKYIK